MPKGVKLTPEERARREEEIVRKRAEKAAIRAEKRKEREEKLKNLAVKCADIPKQRIIVLGDGEVFQKTVDEFSRVATILPVSNRDELAELAQTLIDGDFILTNDYNSVSCIPRDVVVTCCVTCSVASDWIAAAERDFPHVWFTSLWYPNHENAIVGGPRAFSRVVSSLISLCHKKMTIHRTSVKAALGVQAMKNGAAPDFTRSLDRYDAESIASFF